MYRPTLPLGTLKNTVSTTILASALSLLLLDERLFAADLGWRLCFALGAMIALAVLLVRRSVPESPRWLMTHGRTPEAEQIVKQIEKEVEGDKGPLPPPTGTVVTVDTQRRVDYVEIARTMIRTYPSRTSLGLSLMVTQAFLYNAIFFTYRPRVAVSLAITGISCRALTRSRGRIPRCPQRRVKSAGDRSALRWVLHPISSLSSSPSTRSPKTATSCAARACDRYPETVNDQSK